MDKMHETPDRDGIGDSENAPNVDFEIIPENVVRLNSGPDGATSEGRRILLALGYEPIPINGKRPMWEDWTSGAITAERLDNIEARHPDHLSTGCRTGHLSIADIDLRDPSHAAVISELIQTILGLNMFERIERKGVALSYFNPEPIPKVTIAGKYPTGGRRTTLVEFLGTGQQVAAFGIHPDIGRPYQWPNASLFDSKLDDLPEVSPALIREAASAAFNELAELGYTDLRVSESGAGSDSEQSAKAGEPVNTDMLTAMLACIDPACDRMTWIAIAGAIKSANVIDVLTGDDDPDFDGADLFDRWSSGELNPDHEPGNYMGRADCDKVFESVTANRRGGAGVGTIVFHARRGGYAGPSSIPAIELLRGGKSNGTGVSPKGEGEASGDWFQPVAALNERFAIVTGGKHAGRIVDLSNPVAPHFLDGARFHSIYRDVKVTPPATEGNPKPKAGPVSKFWEGWSGRRKVTGIEFVPPGSHSKLPKGTHNLWTGYAVEPKEGEAHARFLAHVRDIICGGDDDLYEWITAWMADLVQRPGDKPGAAVAFRGTQGAGKTIFYRFFKAIFGAHAATASDPRHVVGNFNAHLAGKIILGVEEGFWAGDKGAESRLKDLITAPEMRLEQKGVDSVEIENHLHLMITSNERWVIPVAFDDRRWTIFDVLSDRAERTPENRAYWTRLYADLAGDGPANLLNYLLTRSYDRECLFDPCQTLAKVDQAMESMGSLQQWWLSVLRADRDPTAGRVTSKEDEKRPDGIFGADTPKEMLLDDYEKWCGTNRHLRALSDISFWKVFPHLVDNQLVIHRPQAEGKRARSAWLPPRTICQNAFAKMYRTEWEALDDGEG